MLFFFGIAWPVSIWKSYTARKNSGKSLLYLFIIFLGYVAGTCHKYFYNNDLVIYLYIINGLLVVVDMGVYVRNIRLEKEAHS